MGLWQSESYVPHEFCLRRAGPLTAFDTSRNWYSTSISWSLRFLNGMRNFCRPPTFFSASGITWPWSGVLPSMKSPTVNELFRGAGYAVETVVPKNEINILIPQLRDKGASGIVEMPISKIIP